MINLETKEYCLNKLYDERAEIEKRIEELHIQKMKLKSKDYEMGQFAQERDRINGFLNNAFATHSKTSARIKEFKEDAVTGDCTKCEEKIDEKDLQENPCRRLCIKCQKEANNHNHSGAYANVGVGTP